MFSCVHGSVPSSHPSIHPSIYPSVQWSFNNGPFTFWYRCRVRKYAQGIFRRCGPFTDPMCILSIIAYCLLQYITHGKSPSIVIPRHSKCLSKKCQSSDNLHLKWSCSGTCDIVMEKPTCMDAFPNSKSPLTCIFPNMFHDFPIQIFRFIAVFHSFSIF